MAHVRRLVAVLAAATAALLLTVAPASADSDQPVVNGPALGSFPPAFAYTLLHPESYPAGSNDWGCRPSAAHPDPVVLVHGTVLNAFSSWAEMSPTLAEQGYCVFALHYGGTRGVPTKAIGDIPTSAGQLAAFIDRVLAATGASKVDIVGHSQGGMMPRYYLKNLGGADKVDRLIGLAASNYGTTFNGVLPLIALLPGGEDVVSLAAPAIPQQRSGSAFLTALNAGGDTVPGVRYTVIETRYDEVVTPYRNAFLRDPGATNILLQERCPLDLSEHINLPYSPNVIQLVEHELDPSHRVARCRLVLPLFG